MNNALTKLATAQAAGGRYPRIGCCLPKVEVICTKEGFKGGSAIAELRLRESAPLTASETVSKPGETFDYVESLRNQKKGCGGRFKSFMMTLVGADEFEFANPAASKMFSRMLFVNPPADDAAWEQAIGRIHRQGQLADECEVELYQHTDELTDAFAKARDFARFIEQTEGTPQS
ncbi:hypothetical protein KH5H1_51160 [Corallococcus caeni]|uniref:hypothetical protein n=1 Tax=Corallococcus caeni TaxID=3082388 RepID=UPI00295713E1|nr:hypothetical protein KH5H1_51160 [Corallococcus sp. KH5-1]